MEEKQDKSSEDFEEGNRKRVYQAIFLSLLLWQGFHIWRVFELQERTSARASNNYFFF